HYKVTGVQTCALPIYRTLSDSREKLGKIGHREPRARAAAIRPYNTSGRVGRRFLFLVTNSEQTLASASCTSQTILPTRSSTCVRSEERRVGEVCLCWW